MSGSGGVVLMGGFRIGNRQLVAGCRFRLCFLNRQLNRQLESESATGAKIGYVSVG